MKGALYVGAVAIPIYDRYTTWGGAFKDKASATMSEVCFYDPEAKKFSLTSGAKIWTPVGVLTVVDLVTSKVGLQRRISSAVSGIL